VAVGVKRELAARRAVRAAKGTPCPNAVFPLYAWSMSTSKAYAIPCGAWTCSYCSRKKRAAVRLLIAEGWRVISPVGGACACSP
jgi:hypothetical protein